MDPMTRFCPIRRTLEKELWRLGNALSNLTGQLLNVIRPESQCADVRCECMEARALLSQLRYNLEEHRAAHGC
jgi:hypothetical protein